MTENAADTIYACLTDLLADGLAEYEREGDARLMLAAHRAARAFIVALLDAGMRYEGGRWVGGES